MNIIRKSAAIYAALMAAIAAIPKSIQNVREARQNRSPTSVARAINQRYPFYYAIDPDWSSFDLTAYPEHLKDGLPFVRVSLEELRAARVNPGELRWAFEGEERDPIAFKLGGLIPVRGAGALPLPSPADTIHTIKNKGFGILDMNDAQRIIEWFERKTEENEADYVGIGEILLPFCKGVVAARTAIMVAYTPAFPKPFKLWKLSLKGIMPTLPPPTE